MQQKAQFSKSKVPCLVRHRGGNDYASAKVAGKVIRRSLDTEDFNTAKNPPFGDAAREGASLRFARPRGIKSGPESGR